MITLGIESTAHTLGIGICEDGKIISNSLDTYKPINEGIIPRKAADHHSEVFYSILKDALAKAKIKMADVDLISFAQGPGIGSPLSVGVSGAKYLASKFDKKIIGVNHGYAHMKISENLTGLKNPLYLYVSGGNTQIIIEEKTGPHVIGETLDIGIGNLFDSFGRVIKLEYAHGSVLEQLAKNGKYVELPYTVKGMNLVFSGLLTQAGKLFKSGVSKEDLTYSLMETSFSMVCEATERALFLTRKKKLVVCGGVAQNRRLQNMLRLMCKEDGVKFGVAPDEFNRDNGAMIAYAGEVLYKKYGAKPVEQWKAITRYRIEMIQEIFK
ncbi:tRNA (adenosine(37)-N6)-threonylcarbamoyltransferase complex transferase subunit TsaD [Candidatus Micrarchaeota archaeon]|nr:tRNA (adenosine(37)-N6)-threonylcarbamoyltransferase complex transferase subunit TsaD [Candidatus Micrarchaeota archaeon]